MRRKQTILRSAASATLALGVMFSLVQCNEATGGTDTPSSSSSSVSTSRPDDDDDDDDNGGGSGGSESGIHGNTITVTNSNLNNLNNTLKGNPNVTSVNFSKVTSIPAGVLEGTGVTTVTVPANAQVAEGAFSNTNSNSLTIAVTGSGSVTQTILGGASHVTLDLSKASLQSIDESAFEDCDSLASVILPEGLQSIGDDAFEGCSSLTSINLPDSLETIADDAFKKCTSLASIDLPESLKSIVGSAFQGCTSLTSIDLPDSLERIGSSAFYDCTSLSSVTLPGSLETIGSFSFSSCDNLTRVDLNACTRLDSISIGAFSICDHLAYVTLPNTTNLKIREGAFQAANQETELHLCIPNASMTVTCPTDSVGSVVDRAFTNRIVTLYCNDENTAIKATLENAGAKGTRENGEIEVKKTSDFPGPVSTGLSLFGLPF